MQHGTYRLSQKEQVRPNLFFLFPYKSTYILEMFRTCLSLCLYLERYILCLTFSNISIFAENQPLQQICTALCVFVLMIRFDILLFLYKYRYWHAVFCYALLTSTKFVWYAIHNDLINDCRDIVILVKRLWYCFSMQLWKIHTILPGLTTKKWPWNYW